MVCLSTRTVKVGRLPSTMVRNHRFHWVSCAFSLLSLSMKCWHDDARFVDALVPADSSFASSALPWLRQVAKSRPISPSKAEDSLISKSTTIRIQKTIESDLTEIASFLATASQSSPTNNAWMNKIDLLFAKSDIETLIRRRWRILDKGRLAYMRVKKQLHIAPINGLVDNGCTPPTDQLIKYLWSTNDDLRQGLQVAASETGEDTIWNHHHPMILTPSSVQWFNHLQMSATASVQTNNVQNSETSLPKKVSSFSFSLRTDDSKTERNVVDTKVVGFCEIAMLSNPVLDTNSCPNLSNDCVISIVDSKDHTRHYSPAIANLAIATNMRRRGIATKLLRSAERYVATHWENATTLGLYVSSSNLPAIALYEKCGYNKIIETSSSTGTRVSTAISDDTMWYMSKALRRR